jgi:signal transduction histidine kinase
LIHSLTADTKDGFVFLLAACFCLLMVFKKMKAIVDNSIKKAATTYEIFSMTAILYLTFIFWTVIACPHILYFSGQITWIQYELSSTFIDVATKCVYAATLLTGNFCIMDVVQTLRVAQLKAENKFKSSSVVRLDVMNQALNTAMLEAEAESRLARRFLANISHELRTPLNSVIAFNTLVVEDDSLCSVPAHIEYCSSALTAAESLLGIINQVLDYTSVDHEIQMSSRIALAHEPYSILDIMDEITDIVGSRVNNRKVDFGFELSPELMNAGAKNVFYGDSFRMRQCIVNLADNAIKFSKDLGGEVLVKVYMGASTKEKASFKDHADAGAAEEVQDRKKGLRVNLTIEVIDNGTGIDPEKHFLLFKPFSQVPITPLSSA